MKRYLAFSYADYYPGGGWNDFMGSFDSVEEALAFPIMPESVVDSASGMVVWGEKPWWQDEGRTGPHTAEEIDAITAEHEAKYG